MMEELSKLSCMLSDSSSSIMSLDKSDTNQSADQQHYKEEHDQDGRMGNESVSNFSLISKLKNTYAVDGGCSYADNMNKTNTELGNNDIDDDDDDDLKELNSDMLSEQMSKVVTQLEKHVLDEEPEEGYANMMINTSQTHTESSKLMDTEDDMETDANNKPDGAEFVGKPGSDINDQYVASERSMQNFNEIQIKVIDVPDDDDLFDFLKDHSQLEESSNISADLEKKSLKDMEKRELYRYLTETDHSQIRSNEVTPYQSGEENESGSSSSERSGSTNEMLSESDNEVEETQELEDIERPETPFIDMYSRSDTPVLEEQSRPDTPVLELQSRPETSVLEEPIETFVKVRRRPGPKPRLDQSAKRPKRTPGELTDRTREKLEKCKIATDKWLKDLEVPNELSLEKPMCLNILELNEYLICRLCKGYLYEASTITECMHTFCKNCIVRHCMEVSLHCPVCSILIHPTDPFVHIRLDRMIQDIVYKILPGVAETEFKNIKAFYVAHPEVEPKEIKAPPLEPKISPKEKEARSPRSHSQLVSLVLEAEGDPAEEDSFHSLEKKFVRVTSSATVENLCDFLRKKLSLEENKQVELYCCGDAMEEVDFTLEKIKSKFFGDADCLMLLQYKVKET